MAAITLIGVHTLWAQRGTGEPIGIARQAVQPQPVTWQGTLEAIDTAPCAHTTGRATQGTHLRINTGADTPLNLHIGPTAAVSDLLDQLRVGQTLQGTGFRTERLPEDALVATQVGVNGATYPLRNEQTRPFWAGPDSRRNNYNRYNRQGYGNNRYDRSAWPSSRGQQRGAWHHGAGRFGDRRHACQMGVGRYEKGRYGASRSGAGFRRSDI
jgi:hypothetical protein